MKTAFASSIDVQENGPFATMRPTVGKRALPFVIATNDTIDNIYTPDDLASRGITYPITSNKRLLIEEIINCYKEELYNVVYGMGKGKNPLYPHGHCSHRGKEWR